MMNDYDKLDKAEFRRQTRATLERNAIEAAPDKIQIKDIILILLVIVAAIVSVSEFTFTWPSLKKLTALGIFLYIITTLVYRNRYERGKGRGRADEDYRASLAEYREVRDEIYARNLAGKVPDFCKWYRKKELREYRESLLTDIDMEYDEYREKYLRLSPKEIMRLDMKLEAKTTILKANRAKAIRLTPGMILNESGEADRQQLMGQSGKERERADKRSNAISRALMTLCTGMIAVELIKDFSIVTIIQWCIRMLPVASAIVFGDDTGFCDIAVTETNFKKDQTKIIRIFNEYVSKKNTTTPKS